MPEFLCPRASSARCRRTRRPLGSLYQHITQHSELCAIHSFVVDVLVQQRNALISEIQNLKEEHEVQINALNLTHEMAVRSLEEHHQRELKKREAEG
jgi:hypothetical protein